MSINIDAVLNNIAKNYDPAKAKKKQNTTVDANIFAQASALVAEYKNKQASEKENNSGSKLFGGLSFVDIANMSTSDFLKYAYENKSQSGFDENKTDSSGIKLPFVVRYKGQVVCTAGKTFMSVVAKFHAKYPHRSEEEIAAELLAKYGDNQTTVNNSSANSSTGNSLNLSA
ncbi:MAG: hypothetical protein MJ180_00615 [Candidatus Gastranaerophilales bacterium]|nr:hypothetical protein [Candidatus Gastranaerophilales bacterium]